jgi:large subunit ribosomal protein L32|tara:strand:+ start:426 stop:599 length:174 start_codon:yes stop_codon:yes gene_type:complete
MAVPKRKTSTSKKRMRRSHHKLDAANIVEDKKSGEYKLSHHIDLKSGYYNGKKILDI